MVKKKENFRSTWKSRNRESWWKKWCFYFSLLFKCNPKTWTEFINISPKTIIPLYFILFVLRVIRFMSHAVFQIVFQASQNVVAVSILKFLRSPFNHHLVENIPTFFFWNLLIFCLHCLENLFQSASYNFFRWSQSEYFRSNSEFAAK